MSKQVSVGIIGYEGKFGKFLFRLFNDFGCEVFGSDLKEGHPAHYKNRDVVRRADIVVFSVPPRVTVSVINSLIDYSRPNQLWTDVTSLKIGPVRAMLKSCAEVVGMHPMCAPSVKSLKGQTLIVCPARIKNWSPWFQRFTDWTGAKIKLCEPEFHDRNMAVVQGMVHAMQLIMAATIKSLGQDIAESLEFTSPVYKVALSLIGRILGQNPCLYADIQMLNDYVPNMLQEVSSQLGHLQDIVSKKDTASFSEWFKNSRNHFDEKTLNKSYELFEKISRLMISSND
ncbi:MAG: prephenate dehydrogenase [Parcubacteria group bacterium]|nr:prephenate dehydrogenase [Parcubacteria group bacterium]